MDTDQIQKMTDTELRIAIAKAAGWTQVGTVKEILPGLAECGDGLNANMLIGCDPNDLGIHKDIPNYTGSLDAMHKAEKVILGLEETHGGNEFPYTRNLTTAIAFDPENLGTELHEANEFHATARHRAEALLMTLMEKNK